MTFEERKAEILAEQAKNGDAGAKRIRKRLKPETCKYASDTGELAFPAAPCRGNKIICRHTQNAGFVSYGKQCQRGKCVFFDAE